MLLAAGPVSGAGVYQLAGGVAGNAGVYGAGDYSKLDGERLFLTSSRFGSWTCVMVPMRVIFEALGCTVGWDEGTRTAAAEKDGVAIYLQIDNELMYRNGEMVVLDAVPCQIGDRTLVPIRAVSEDALARAYSGNTMKIAWRFFQVSIGKIRPLSYKRNIWIVLGKKPAEVAAAFGPVSGGGAGAVVCSITVTARVMCGLSTTGARPDKDGQIGR